MTTNTYFVEPRICGNKHAKLPVLITKGTNFLVCCCDIYILQMRLDIQGIVTTEHNILYMAQSMLSCTNYGCM